LPLRTENNDRALRAGGCYGVERCGARKLEASQKCSCHELRWKNCAPIARPEFSEKIWEILASLPPYPLSSSWHSRARLVGVVAPRRRLEKIESWRLQTHLFKIFLVTNVSRAP
jgi:hypothetical protein